MDFMDYDTRLAAYAVIVDDDRLLLTWYNGRGRGKAAWSMPGGGVEFDESVPHAVEREVFEETGYAVAVGAPLAVDHFTRPDWGRGGRPYKSVRVIFDAHIVGGTLGTTEVDGSTDFAEWVPLDGISTLTPKADIVEISLAAFNSRGRLQ